MRSNVSQLLVKGVAIVAVTRGKDGCSVFCADEERFKKSPALPQEWAGREYEGKSNGYVFDENQINSNGAGDAWTSGFLAAAMMRACSEWYKAPKNKQAKEKEKKQKSSKPKKVGAPLVSSFGLFAEEVRAKATKKILQEGKMVESLNIDELASECKRLWNELGKDEVRKYCDTAASMNRAADLSILEDAFSNSSDELPQEPVSSEESTEKKLGPCHAMLFEEAVAFASEVAARHVDARVRGKDFIDVGPFLPDEPQERAAPTESTFGRRGTAHFDKEKYMSDSFSW